LTLRRRVVGGRQRLTDSAQVRDAGNLLTLAQFTLQAVDTDEMAVQYGDVTELVEHLRVSSDRGEVALRRARAQVLSLARA